MIGVGLLGMTNYALIRDSPHTKDSNAMPIRVKSRGNETAEQMLRRFKKLCEREGITKDLKRRQYHEKPSEIKRREEIRGHSALSQFDLILIAALVEAVAVVVAVAAAVVVPLHLAVAHAAVLLVVVLVAELALAAAVALVAVALVAELDQVAVLVALVAVVPEVVADPSF